MGSWSKTRLLTTLVAGLAVLVIGAGVVMAARGSAVGPLAGSSGRAAEATPQDAHHDLNEFEAHGMIQTITFDQGTTSSGNLEFLADGQQATIIVDFTAQTRVEVQGGLQPNVAVRVEGTTQGDGSVLANEIEDDAAAAANENDAQEDQQVAGVIQSVDTNAQTFLLQPDGQTTTLTIAYDKNTEIEREDGASVLAAGQQVTVEVVKRADGSLYAREIKGGQNDGDRHGGDDGSGDGDHSGSGSGSGDGDHGGSGSGSGSGH